MMHGGIMAPIAGSVASTARDHTPQVPAAPSALTKGSRPEPASQLRTDSIAGLTPRSASRSAFPALAGLS